MLNTLNLTLNLSARESFAVESSPRLFFLNVWREVNLFFESFVFVGNFLGIIVIL